MSNRPPLKVRGSCPKCGKTVETEAPAGRVTWRGPCPKDGCDGRIYASRIRAGDRPPAPDKQTDKPPATSGRPRRKVGPPVGYRQDDAPKLEREPDGAGPGAAGRPADDRRPAEHEPDRRPADVPRAGDDAAGDGPDDSGGRRAEPEAKPEHGGDEQPRRRRLFRRPDPEHPRRSVTPYEHLY